MHSDIFNKPTLQLEFMPEYALPYLIYLLAHHKDFNEKDLTIVAK